MKLISKIQTAVQTAVQNTVQTVAKQFARKAILTSVGLGTVFIPMTTLVSSLPAQANVNNDFANGKVIELVTNNGLRVNMHKNERTAPIFGLERDGSADQQWVIEWQPNIGFKLRKQGTQIYLTVKDFPAKEGMVTEGWTKSADNNVAATWVALGTNQPGYYNICLRYSPRDARMCLDIDNLQRLNRFVVKRQNASFGGQYYKPVGVGAPVTNNPQPQQTTQIPETRRTSTNWEVWFIARKYDSSKPLTDGPNVGHAWIALIPFKTTQVWKGMSLMRTEKSPDFNSISTFSKWPGGNHNNNPSDIGNTRQLLQTGSISNTIEVATRKAVLSENGANWVRNNAWRELDCGNYDLVIHCVCTKQSQRIWKTITGENIGMVDTPIKVLPNDLTNSILTWNRVTKSQYTNNGSIVK
jgi:hypothetical protein